MKTINITFEGGESSSGEGCNFMRGAAEADGEEIVLYAEVKISDWDDCPEYDPEDPDSFDLNGFDDFSYPILKAEITRQAEVAGIDVNRLSWFYND